jgi:hypothetical protein
VRRVRRHGYGPDLDPVGRHAGDDVLGRALRKLFKPAERRILLDSVNGAPFEQVARRHGLQGKDVERLVSGWLHRLRTSEYGEQLQQELFDRHGPRHSPELWAAAKELAPHRCEREGCTSPPFTQPEVGRTKKYCSTRCRVAAHRARARMNASSSVGSRTAEQTTRTNSVKPRRGYRWVDYDEDPPELPAAAPLPDGYQSYYAYRLGWKALPALPVIRDPSEARDEAVRPRWVMVVGSHRVSTLWQRGRRSRVLREQLLGRYGMGWRAVLASQPTIQSERTLTSPMHIWVPLIAPPPRITLPSQQTRHRVWEGVQAPQTGPPMPQIAPRHAVVLDGRGRPRLRPVPQRRRVSTGRGRS